MPKKITYNAAAVAETLHDAKSYGFSVRETAPFDWSTFKRKRDDHIKRLNAIFARNLENDKVDYLHGRGRLGDGGGRGVGDAGRGQRRGGRDTRGDRVGTLHDHGRFCSCLGLRE